MAKGARQTPILGRSMGAARVVAEVPFSDGTTAYEITNFTLDERGILDSTFRLMPLIPAEWRGADQPADLKRGVLKMVYTEFWGDVPELLFLCKTTQASHASVARFAPWDRGAGGVNPGLEAQVVYAADNTTYNPQPQGEVRYPPQALALGNRVYFTWCDGGQAYVWDGVRVRPFGFHEAPGPCQVDGPAREDWDEGQENSGGFSVRGRIGTTASDWTRLESVSNMERVVGGVDDGRWDYYIVFEGPDGAYSPMSPASNPATVRLSVADPTEGRVTETMTRRFRVMSIPQGPEDTVARIVLRTRNLQRLPVGDNGEPRFCHRIPNNVAQDWIDDIPDGELGDVWEDREPTPIGFYFLEHFGGSTWMFSTDEHGSRGWWSEQTSALGPISESVLKGHWRDIFPSTGRITGSLVANMAPQSEAPVMYVFKEEAIHFVTGEYPLWRFGTLHKRWGAAGPDLVQVCPDGSVVGYGGRTFWRIDPSGKVDDVGGGIRKRLRRINPNTVRMGTSWLNRETNEVIFALPLDDSETNDFQFRWDYKNLGFRFGDDVQVDTALSFPGADIVLLAGTYTPAAVAITTVWAYGRGYPGYSVNAPTWVYSTGWLSFVAPGPDMHAHVHLQHMVFMGEERGDGSPTVDTYLDWNHDSVESDLDNVTAAHADDDALAFYDDAAGGTTDAAVYDTDVYRERRVYTYFIPADTDASQVFRAEMSGTDPFAIVTLDGYGPVVAPPGARQPTRDT